MQRVLKILAILAGIFLLAYLLWELQLILLYILIAVVISFIGRPIMGFLEKFQISGRHLPHPISALIALIIIVAFFAGVVSLFIPMIVKEYESINKIDISLAAENLEQPLQEIKQSLARYGLDRVIEVNGVKELQSGLKELLSIADIPQFVGSVFGTVTNLLIACFSIIFITFFFLKDARLFGEILLTLTPDDFVPQMTKVLEQSKRLLTRYFVGILIQIAIVTTLATIGLTVLDVRSALLIGIFAGAINVIPYLGPVLGAAFGIIVAVTTNIELSFYHELLPLIGRVALVFAIIQLLDNFVLQPLIFSNSVSAHPLEIFLVVLSAGTLGGIVGMIIAIPTYTIIRVIAKQFLNEFKIVKKLTKDI